MKICTIICEYNPFHNGHLYQLQKAKELTCADAVVCIMSGNFVQRGESAILDKYTRAKHAILAGADAVIELPTIFATSNAELFAKGAVKIGQAGISAAVLAHVIPQDILGDDNRSVKTATEIGDCRNRSHRKPKLHHNRHSSPFCRTVRRTGVPSRPKVARI